MRRRIGLLMSLALLASAVLPQPTFAASVSWASRFAVESIALGQGSTIYQSGTPNYLRTTAKLDLVGVPSFAIRQGTIRSSSLTYTGASGGRVNWKVNGTFSRELAGGFSVFNGAAFRHRIQFELVDSTQGSILGSWTYVDETILCGGLSYPVGLGGCNDTASDTYGIGMSLSTTGSNVKKGDVLYLRVRVTSDINGNGIVFGLTGKTQARGMSGSITW